MPVEPVREPERLLEVDLAFAIETGSAAQRLARDVDAEAPLSALHHGEAGAVDRDAVTHRDVAEPELPRCDRKAQPTFCALDTVDSPDCSYDAAEHGRNSTWRPEFPVEPRE